MGYDCTLHLIDPASITRFVDWLLGRPVEAADFERAFDAPEVRQRVLEALGDEGSYEAGPAVLEGLLLFCSAEAPHVYSRGFCVGLWDELPLDLADAVPLDLQDSRALAPLLAPLTERWPALRCYTGITGNYTVGHYVPPGKVPALRAHVERALEELPFSWQDAPKKLLQVLRAAEARGLGYWEATDLAVASGNPEWLEAGRLSRPAAAGPRAAGLRVIELPGADSPTLSFEADGVAVLGCLGQWATWIVDARVEPARVQKLEGLCLRSIVRAPDGRTLATGRPTGESRGAVYELDLEVGRARPLPVLPDWEEPAGLARLDDEVLVFPGPADAYHRAARPTWLGDGRALALPDGVRACEPEVFSFGDGSALLLTDGRAFRLRGVETTQLTLPPVRTWALDQAPQGLTVGEGSVLLCARVEDGANEDSRLVTISRDGAWSDVLPELARAYPAWPAPDGAVVVDQTDPLERDLFKIYWHAAREVASVPLAWVGETGPCRDALCSPALDELWINYGQRILRVPWREVAALPRQSASAFAEAHRASVAARERRAHERRWQAIRESPLTRGFDDPESLLLAGSIIDHPQHGRGIVTTQALEGEYEAEFEDGTRRCFPRARRHGE